MITAVLLLIAAGLLSGLVQYYVDYKKLPIYQENVVAAAMEEQTAPGFCENVHDKHAHISVKCEKDMYYSTTPWTIKLT